MTTARKPSPPRVLARRGRALWRALHADLEFDAHESEIVLEACRTADTIDQLQAAVDEQGVTALGSMGQTIVHPAVAEIRQQQASLSRLLTTLNLNAALEGQTGDVAMQRAISAQASAAANARWARSKGARGA